MPIESKAQQRFMFAVHPDIARRWMKKYGLRKNLPEHKGDSMDHTAEHPGFQALVARGVPAGALANTSRNASEAAKRKNPRLRRVKPKAKHRKMAFDALYEKHVKRGTRRGKAHGRS